MMLSSSSVDRCVDRTGNRGENHRRRAREVGPVSNPLRSSVDRGKADKARALVAARSTSEVIDLALDRLIDTERLRRDIAAYRRSPPHDSEGRMAELAAKTGLADETE